MTDTMDGELVTLHCTEEGCEFSAVGPTTGKGSASWKLGSHRWRAHGIRSDNPKTRASAQYKRSRDKQPRGADARKPTEDDFEERPVLAVVRDSAAEAGAGKHGVPSAEDLTKGLARGLSLSTVGVASWCAETDPTIPFTPDGERQKQALTDYLSLDDHQAREVMAPIARLIQPTRLNKRFGRQMVDNADAAGGIATLAILALHYRQYFRLRRQAEAQLTGVAPVVTAEAPPPPGPSGNGAYPPGTVLSRTHLEGPR